MKDIITPETNFKDENRGLSSVWLDGNIIVRTMLPADTPQLRRHILSKGASELTFKAHPECTTVYSLKLETAQ